MERGNISCNTNAVANNVTVATTTIPPGLYGGETDWDYSEELRKVREENPANIPSLVAIWLKSLLMERINELMTVVSIGIEDAIVYFGSSNYFTFGDYLNAVNQNNRNRY